MYRIPDLIFGDTTDVEKPGVSSYDDLLAETQSILIPPLVHPRGVQVQALSPLNRHLALTAK